MKPKKLVITGIILAAVVVIALVGYNIYRYPAAFKNLSDNSLEETQVNALKDEIFARQENNVLIAYFSYSGTTKGIAESLSQKLDADLFEITPKKTYDNVYTESNSEIRKSERPELTDTVSNIDEYDIIFVGFPIWWHATPAPVNTFLESYDLTGKLIIPFCTSGESDISEAMPTFLDSCDGLAVYGEKRISGSGQLNTWLDELGFHSGVSKKSESTEEMNNES